MRRNSGLSTLMLVPVLLVLVMGGVAAFRTRQLNTSGSQVVIPPVPQKAPTAIVTAFPIQVTTAGTYELIPAIANQTIYISSLAMTFEGGNVTAQIVSGTGVACATNQVARTGIMFNGIAVAAGFPTGFLFQGSNGAAICIKTVGNQDIGGWIGFAQLVTGS